MKKILIRFTNGFCYSIAITLIIQFAVMLITSKLPMIPEYSERFSSDIYAFCVQLILIGVMSGITSSGTAVFSIRKMGFVFQSLLFLIIMLSAWIPVSCFVWSINKYKSGMLITICSIVITYSICWAIEYRQCKKDVETINAELSVKESI